MAIISYILFVIVMYYGLKLIIFGVLGCILNQRVERAVNIIYNNKPDERSQRDFLIELNRVTSYSYDVTNDFLNPFLKYVDSSKWVNPDLIQLLNDELAALDAKSS